MRRARAIGAASIDELLDAVLDALRRGALVHNAMTCVAGALAAGKEDRGSLGRGLTEIIALLSTRGRDVFVPLMHQLSEAIHALGGDEALLPLSASHRRVIGWWP